MSIEQALEEFILACRADGLSAATVKWYTAMLTPFVEAFSGRELTTIIASEIRRWIVGLMGRDLSEETVKSHKRAILRFWRWSAQEWKIENPAAGIKHPGTSKGDPRRAINHDDAVKMFRTARNVTKDSTPIHAARDLALLAILLEGCRAGGLLSMNVRDLNVKKRYILASEKRNNGRQNVRRVRMSKPTLEILLEWVRLRPEGSPEALWLAVDKKGKVQGRLKYAGLYNILKRIARRAGVEGRFNPHSFRHGFGQRYVLQGGDLGSASQIMGHSSVQITSDIYGQFESEVLSRLLDRNTPMKEVLNEAI